MSEDDKIIQEQLLKVRDNLIKEIQKNENLQKENGKLRECLQEAVSEMCNLTCEASHSECAKTENECFVAKWRECLEGDK